MHVTAFRYMLCVQPMSFPAIYHTDDMRLTATANYAHFDTPCYLCTFVLVSLHPQAVTSTDTLSMNRATVLRRIYSEAMLNRHDSVISLRLL